MWGGAGWQCPGVTREPHGLPSWTGLLGCWPQGPCPAAHPEWCGPGAGWAGLGGSQGGVPGGCVHAEPGGRAGVAVRQLQSPFEGHVEFSAAEARPSPPRAVKAAGPPVGGALRLTPPPLLQWPPAGVPAGEGRGETPVGTGGPLSAAPGRLSLQPPLAAEAGTGCGTRTALPGSTEPGQDPPAGSRTRLPWGPAARPEALDPRRAGGPPAAPCFSPRPPALSRPEPPPRDREPFLARFVRVLCFRIPPCVTTSRRCPLLPERSGPGHPDQPPTPRPGAGGGRP